MMKNYVNHGDVVNKFQEYVEIRMALSCVMALIETPIQSIINAYLIQRSTIFAELTIQKEQGWANSQADKYFQHQQKSADKASPNLEKIFMEMMREIAKEMDKETQFLTDINAYKKNNPCAPKVLDLCMAPGGFSAEVRERLRPLAYINGITLPLSLGGHRLLLEKGQRKNVEYLDITMLASEMGATNSDIPLDHPDKQLFVLTRPFLGKMYDLILSDGQVLRTHKRGEHRQKLEGLRLRVSQLIFALQHIEAGGTFVMLLHRLEEWPILKIIYTFTTFSSRVYLFKPTKKHAIRSSFYLVAKGVQPQEAAALQAVEEWKEIWRSATFHFSTWNLADPTEHEVESVLADFGETFINLCNPLWKIQSGALSREQKNGWKKNYLK